MQVPYRLFSTDEILAFPPIRWLVRGLIPTGALAVLYGPYGSGKSFLALDLAWSVATGQHWLMQEVKPGPVVYVAAGEGVSGLRNRIRAWQEAYQPIEQTYYLTEAVQLHQAAQVKKFLTTIQPIQPSLVVFDTLARCFAGVSEDTVESMGMAVQAADQIRQQTGATVLFVHHTGHADEEGKVKHRPRGSSGLPAAADTMLEVVPRGKEAITLYNTKQKEGEEWHPIKIHWRKVEKRGKVISLIPSVI